MPRALGGNEAVTRGDKKSMATVLDDDVRRDATAVGSGHKRQLVKLDKAVEMAL